jgi:thioredoxin reductase
VSRTVDLVVTGDDNAALSAVIDTVRRGQRVLVVLHSGDARASRRVRRAANADDGQLTVMTNAEVVCVDGVGDVDPASCSTRTQNTTDGVRRRVSH